MNDSVKTYTVGEVMRLFGLETAGDAWDLIITKGWDCVQPDGVTKWQITIPPEDQPLVDQFREWS